MKGGIEGCLGSSCEAKCTVRGSHNKNRRVEFLPGFMQKDRVARALKLKHYWELTIFR